MRGDLQDAGGRRGVDEVGVCFNCHESGVELWVKWGAGVVANESAEGCVHSSRAATAESIAEKASPANSLACPCEPLADGASAELWRVLHGAFSGTRRIWVVEVVKKPLRGGDSARRPGR